jgi:hypothetical protein
VADRRPLLVPVLACAISALLSSGLTAVVLRHREPGTVAQRPPLTVTPEQRDLATLLVTPGPPYVAVNAGEVVPPSQGLTTLGLTRGWRRQFRTPSADRIDVIVLEFASASGARGYAQGIGRAAQLLVKPRPFTVSGVPGGSALADTVRDRDGKYAQVVVMHRGVRAALLVFAVSSATPGPEVAALAQRQYAALPAP